MNTTCFLLQFPGVQPRLADSPASPEHTQEQDRALSYLSPSSPPGCAPSSNGAAPPRQFTSKTVADLQVKSDGVEALQPSQSWPWCSLPR